MGGAFIEQWWRSAKGAGAGGALLLSCGTLVAPGAALAQDVEAQSGAPAQAAQQHREAFEAMLEDPTDTEKAFRFAEAAVAVGDLEGAIAALERILQIEPNRPDIRLRLGELYQRAGVPEVAEVYLERGLETAQMPPAVRERAEALQERARVAVARHLLFGNAFLGARYETNANAGPDSRLVSLFGRDVFLEEEDVEEDDFSAVGWLDLDYLFDLGTQAGHTLETDVLLFGTRQLDVDEANTWLIDAEVGPRLFLGEVGAPAASLRPFGTVSFLALDDEDYLIAYGGGLNARTAVRPDLVLEATARAVFQDFNDTEEQPRASDQTGPYYTLRPGITWRATGSTIASLDGIVGYADADEDFESFLEYGAALSFTQLFPVPFPWVTDQRWSATLTGAYRRTGFEEPEPIPGIATEEQEDDRYDISLSFVLPMTEDLGLSVTGRHTINDSNVGTEEFDNTEATLGVAFAF